MAVTLLAMACQHQSLLELVLTLTRGLPLHLLSVLGLALVLLGLLWM